MARKHKSLHESAAEILAASVANAGKEPMPMSAMMMEPPADLGGATNMAEPSALGAAASGTMAMSPKPGNSGVPAEPIKVAPEQAEEIGDEEEALEKNPADTGKMKVSEELEGEALMESLIAEHGAEMVLESFISEYGETAVFNSIMEEYVNEYGADVVAEKFGETLFEQYGEESVIAFIAENVIAEFGEQEFTDEEFGAIQEQSNIFITEMQTLSDEDFDNYIVNLNEEELVYAIQLSSLNEEYLVEFLKKIGKALKKGVKAVGKVAKKVISNPLFSTVASFALPGIGTALGAVGSKLASTALGKAVGAVGSKIAGSALGKGVAALGKTAIGGALKNAAGGALKGGISSVLQGGKFKEGAKLGAISGVASPLVNKVAGGLTNLTGSEALGTTAADALAGGIASKATGGKFSQGAKTGAIGSLVGRAAGNIRKGFGDNAGDVADAVGGAVTSRSAGGASAGDEPAETTDVSDSDQTNDRPTTRAPAPPQRPQPTQADEPSDDEDYDNLGSSAWRNVARRGAAARAAATRGGIREEADELLNHLSTLNEQELDAFIDQLSEEESELISDILNEKAETKPAKPKNPRGVDSRIKRDKAADKNAEYNARMEAERKRIAREGLKAADGTQIIPPAGGAAAAPSAAGDEQKYGKTGAAIRSLDKDAYGKRKDKAFLASLGITAAPGSAEANMQLLDKLKGRSSDAKPVNLSYTTGTGGGTPSSTPTQDVIRKPANASATPAQMGEPGMTEWDYADTWERNPIERGSGRRVSRGSYDSYDSQAYDSQDDMDEPGKKGIGLFYTPTGEKTALRKAIPNELVAVKDVVGNLLKVKELGWKPGTNRFGYKIDENVEDSNMTDENGEETTMETTELTEEQIREERLLAIKEAVKQFKGTMREDVDALFNGESLSEEFRAKATLIFESAVTSRVESILEQVMQQNDEVLATAYEEIKDQLTEQVDEYLNYVVEQWMDNNKVAIETGLRAELAEDFISGLRSLFQEHYIEIPEEKVDVAETLAAELENAGEYVQSVHAHVEEQDAVIADLQEQLNDVKKEKAINNFCEGLTLVQAEKMKALAEGVEFTTEGDFEEKLAVLRENYFPTKVQVKSEVKEIQQAMLNEEPEVEQVNNVMNRYVKAISKTAPKA